MIEANVGNVERLVRLALGILMFSWAWSQSGMNAVDWFELLVSIALVLNGVFSRCYLWYVLEINTCRDGDKNCQPQSSCP